MRGRRTIRRGQHACKWGRLLRVSPRSSPMPGTTRSSSPSTATSPPSGRRLTELDVDCAFNLCESLCGDARLESAVPLLLELLGHPLHGLASRGAELRASQRPREAAARGGRHPDAAGPRPDEAGRGLRPAVPAHRQAGEGGRLRRDLANQRRPQRGRARSSGRGRADDLPAAGARRAVHRRARAQRGADRPPDATRPPAERDRLRRPAARRAAHRLVRREVDDRVGRRPRHRAGPSSAAPEPDRRLGSAAPRRRLSVRWASATTAGSTCASRRPGSPTSST